MANEGGKMTSKKYRNAAGIVIFALLAVLFFSGYGAAYNKSWDQGHKCVNPTGGDLGWGRYGYDTTSPADINDGYTSIECCELLCKICPVYAHTGRLQKTFTDLTIPGVGPSLAITRTYLSQEQSTSLLGHGWIFNLGKRLIIQRNKAGDKIVVVRQRTGEINFFKEHLNSSLERLTSWGLTYDLVKNTDNTYTIVSRNGTWYELREDGNIAKIIDQNQNELVFSYNSVGCLSRITNASGNYVNFQLAVNGKIASVSDNLGRTVAYGYDENGNLVSVTDPMGNTTQYVYNSNNLLAQIIDARGNVVESATYDNNQPPRVSTFVEKGETYTIVYFDGRTEKTDSQGNKWTYYFNDVGIIERVIDPLGNETNQQPNKVTSTSVDWEEDANENRTTYTYDADGNIDSKTDPLGNTWIYSYNTGTDLLETETDPLGTLTRYQYDSYGNQISVVRDFGGSQENTSIYAYNSQGNQTSFTDPLGNTTTYEYDANGNLIQMTDPLGNVTTYTYDSRGNRLAETDANGNTTTYSYDVMDRLVSVIDALGNITTYTHDANGNRTSETDADGNTRTFAYDVYNRVIQETDLLGNIISYAYDSRDNRISMTDANGNTTSYTYDILDRLIGETNALGGQKNYTYDAAGNLLTVTDANGNTTTFTYDANNRKISEKNAAGETTSYSYDASGNLITLTLPNSNTITRTYDSLNRLVNIADTLGQIRSYTYNLADLLLTDNDALGNTTSYSYDANNRLIQQTDPMGNSMGYTYDAVGNLVTTTDREGNTSSYAYDALRRRVSVTDQLGNTSTFSFDKVGNLLSITDANGNVTGYSYDNGNRLIQETYADGTIRSFVYDANGNMIGRTDQNGDTTTCIYDALNRRTNVDYPGSKNNVYTYDAVGNLSTANNQDATISLSYDNAYRLTQSVQNGQTVSYSYDIPNSTKTITYPGAKVVKEVRNVSELLTRVENASSQVIVQYTYDGADRLQTKSYINGITANFTNNANGWITDIDYSDGVSQIIGFQYGFDKEGNRQYAKKLHDTSNSEQYIYDAKYRLAQFKRGILDANNEIPVPLTQTAYNLDALSNWASKTTDGVTENRTHNEMNEITDIDGVSLVYDDNGNLADDGTDTYEYDYENRLIKATRKSGSSILCEYKYDALGRRIEKQASGDIIVYYYDGNRVIEEQVGGITEATYVFGISIDEVVTMERGGQIYYYQANSLGSIVALTDSSGKIIEQYIYNAYGTPDINSAFDSPYMFTGRRFDEETELYYCRARHYNGDLGRFLQIDPLGYMDSMNLYEYAQNNPVNLIDPSGMASEREKIIKNFMDWHKKNSNLSWLKFLPDCPDKLCLNKNGSARKLNRDDWKKFDSPTTYFPGHPGAHWCMRSKETRGKHGQQCCYFKNGNLLTSKYSLASGTPDYRHWTYLPYISVVNRSHYHHDVKPFNWAQELDGKGTMGKYTRMYQDRRPPNKGGGAKLKKEDCCDNGPK